MSYLIIDCSPWGEARFDVIRRDDEFDVENLVASKPTKEEAEKVVADMKKSDAAKARMKALWAGQKASK